MKTSIFLIVTGIILLVVSFILRAEQITQRHKIEGTKSSTAAAGALIGGTTGAVVGSTTLASVIWNCSPNFLLTINSPSISRVCPSKTSGIVPTQVSRFLLYETLITEYPFSAFLKTVFSTLATIFIINLLYTKKPILANNLFQNASFLNLI